MRFAVLVLGLLCTCGAAYADRFAIVGARVFDGTGAAPVVATVVVADGLIESVTPGSKSPAGVKKINAKGLALLPGFYDLHTHYTPAGQPATPPDISASYVASGVTTVNDFHEQPESYASRREWYATFPGPHVNFAARMSTPGGHGADWADINTTRWVNTPYAAKAAIEALAPYKPDFIKVFTDGWRYGSGIDNTSMDEPTLTALVAAAHEHNFKVGTHTLTLVRGKIAARAGVDIIVHSLQDAPVDREVIDLMLAHHTAYAPTLAVYEPIKPGQATPTTIDERLQGRLDRFAIALGNVKALHDAGVPIVVGTDAGMPATIHGPATLREMELLVKAGLTPAEALVAGTRASAAAMNQTDRGVIAAGKRADMVLVKGAPWDTISDIRKTERTFVDGKTMFIKGGAVAHLRPAPDSIPVSAPLIADFERADGRTTNGALVITDADSGVDRSVELLAVVPRQGGGKALAITSRMAQRADPRTEAILPLAPGGIQPVDAHAFSGVMFEAMGAGSYELAVTTIDGTWTAPFEAPGEWTSVSVPFATLAASAGKAALKTEDMLSVRFVTEHSGGEAGFLEVDNVAFY
jgi:imidazolonepropionase-like amidohydrolase